VQRVTEITALSNCDKNGKEKKPKVYVLSTLSKKTCHKETLMVLTKILKFLTFSFERVPMLVFKTSIKIKEKDSDAKYNINYMIRRETSKANHTVLSNCRI
jgi:hypothetical protein